jgi:GDP-D-mannose 3',5'-epimerase
MRVIVTGGCGMIGSNFIRRLKAESDIEYVVVVDNLWRGKLENIKDDAGNLLADLFVNEDLMHPGILDKIIKEHNIDTVVHFADMVAGVSYVLENEGDIFHTNLIINTNVIRSIRANKDSICTFINIGTACSFPKQLQNGLDSILQESQLYPANPETAYGWSKLMGCYETTLLSKETNINAVNLYFHNVYGPPCDTGPRSQVLPSLIKRAILAPPGGTLSVWGSGKQGRAFVYVDDVVDAVVSAMRRAESCNGLDIQIGPDICTSIAEVAQTIVEISGKGLRVEFDETKPEGDMGRCANYELAQKMLDWTPKISLKDGIITMYKWIEALLANTISIVVPTRKRAIPVKELIESAKNTADDFSRVQFCFYVDADDDESRVAITNYSKDYTECAGIEYTTSQLPLKLSGMWNYAYDKLAFGDITMLCGDDIRFRSKGWDTRIIQEFDAVPDKILLVYGDDQLRHSATHSFVHRRWIQTSGFWLPPYFVADYCDTWLAEVATGINRIKYLPDVITEHMHFSVGKSAYDNTTELRLMRAHRENPGAIYAQKHGERLEHMAKLRALI